MITIQQLRKLALAISTIMVVSLLVPMISHAANVIERTVNVNGSSIQTSVIMDNNYQLVPAVWFQNLSANVTWNVQHSSAVVSGNDTIVGFPTGQSFADYDLNGLNEWKQDKLNTTNYNLQGRIYVPLAYTAQKLGMQVTYDAQSKITSIHDAATTTITASQPSATSDDVHWLNQITEAEAGGESYKGKLAVAATVLNRVDSPDWPDSIKETIFQVTINKGVSSYQFSPVRDNRIHNVTPSEDAIKAVKAALSGEDPTEGAVVFYNPDKTNNQWVRSREVTVTIGNHIFAR
jgi:YD repeat-containing protein